MLAVLGLSASFSLPAQVPIGSDGVVISGRVTSEYGAPRDAEVLIESMGISVRSSGGRYSLTIPPARTLGQSVVIRARTPGFLPESKTLTLTPGSQSIDFALRRDVNKLNEVVVLGAVTATAQNKLAFSVTRLDSSDLALPSPNALQQLQAKVPGATVVQPSGRPGQAPAILLRGAKSINGAGRSQEPLIIIDGAIVNAGTQVLNPDDIESIEVIKGAAASTLYGSRAGAGVIQVTTKGTTAGQGPRVSTRSEYGFSEVHGTYRYALRHPMVMDETLRKFCVRVAGQPMCSRVVDFEEEARRINDVFSPAALLPQIFERDFTGFGAGLTPSKPELKGVFQVNPWPVTYVPIRQAVTPGAYLNNAIDLSARSGGTGVFASLSSLDQDGAVRYLRGYQRNTARANVDQVVNELLNLSVNTTFARSRQYPAVGNLGFSTITDVSDEQFVSLTRVPAGVNLLRRDQLGRLYIRPNPLTQGGESTNPLYGYENLEGRQDDDRFLGSLTARYAATPSISVDAVASADRRRMSELGYIDRDYRTFNSFPNNGGGTRGAIDERAASDLSANLMLSARATFSRGGDLQGALLARYSYEQQERQSSSAHGEQLSYPRLLTLNNATANLRVQSERYGTSAIGVIGGAQLEYKGRYVLDALARYDGSSLFGIDERWHPYYRTSFAWRASDEPSWPLPGLVNDLKVRASVGTAGGRPNFSAQYETFALSAGLVTASSTLGNKQLKPEQTLETEVGFDAELFRAIGVSLTYARDITSDQLLAVPAPVASGYTNQWQNAGTLEGSTWEASVRIPILMRQELSWTAQLGWDRHRTYIAELDTPPFFQTFARCFGTCNNPGYSFYIAPGERIGTMYGRRFATSCAELPSPFNSQCGPGKEWQHNDEGYVVWVGEGYSPSDGITKNLWQAMRPGCVKDGVVLNAPGAVECSIRGGTVNAPWGVPETHWGMPTVLRDSTATNVMVPLGNTMPDYRLTLSQNVRWKRLTVHALLDMSRGNMVFNSERRWSLGEFNVREQDQDGKTVERAKPLGYYWRGHNPPAVGVGGFYVDNVASNHSVEDGSYTKLREVLLSYELRQLPLVPGSWSVAVAGRNLLTWTRYTGWDPEGGSSTLGGGITGSPNSAAIVTGGMFQYPATRTFTFMVSSRF